MGISFLIMQLVSVYEWLLIISILMTWFPDIMRTAIGRFLIRITDPYFALFRKFIPSLRMGAGAIDFSPIIAIFVYDYPLKAGIRQILLYLNLG